ncbi:MAG: cytochrome P450 [Actinomycetota bacterium]
MAHTTDHPLLITTWDAAREAYRSKHLRQGLYDGGVVMENVLINLHGLAHRDRRRLENPLFRREVLAAYERDEFPAVLAARLEPHLESGRMELLEFGHSVMLELAAINAGVDIDRGDPHALDRLHRQLLAFIDGARILHYVGDKEAKERQVAEALADFDAEFVTPGIGRRVALLADRDAGRAGDDAVPRDILRVMLENTEGLELDRSTIVRETAFFLLTGASTSAVALTRTLHNVFAWIAERPDDEARLIDDPTFVQLCVLESLRLAPISPIAARWATEDVTLTDGTVIAAGERVHIDMGAANRDASVFGADADEFRPERPLPDGVPRPGVSFGHGMHHCIGQELAVGVEPTAGGGTELILFGLVGTVIRELLRLGVRPDPDRPAEGDDLTERATFKTYPVILTRT